MIAAVIKAIILYDYATQSTKSLKEFHFLR